MPRAAAVGADSTLVVLAFVEARTVTGPVANLLALQREADRLRLTGAVSHRLELVIARWHRPHDGDPLDIPVARAAADAGVRVVTMPERCRFDPRVVAAFVRTVKAVRCDVVQTHSVKSHAIARLAGFDRTAPWIAFHHGYTWPDWRMRTYNQLDRWSLRAAERVVIPTDAFARDLLARGVSPAAIRVVPNALDLAPRSVTAAERTRARRALGYDGDERVIVTIGRLSSEKGHADLIAAVAQLQRRRPDLRLRVVIAGDGRERQRLERLARQVAATLTVRLLGEIVPGHPLYAAADLAVLPSHSEGSPNALLEAAAYGVPIVATAVGGVPELFPDGRASVLVPAHDSGALGAAIEQVIGDPTLAARLGRGARAALASRTTAADRARLLLSLYAEVARCAPPEPMRTACAS